MIAPLHPLAPAQAQRPTLSAVMPAYNAAHHLPQTLAPLLALLAEGAVDEVILVDDGSDDGTAELACALGARVLRSGQRAGPAAARNLAAQSAHGEVLWFVDADVAVRPDAAERLARHFLRAEVVAVFGSYCDAPPGLGFFSQYKNLVHHFQHQRNGGRSSSFWTGCGAVRRQTFLDLGGFDAALFACPSIEDVEFGFRLRLQGGHTELDPLLLCTHHKRWNLRQVLATDILHRALPWSRLIMTRRAPADELNVSNAERRAAAVAAALLASLPLAAIHPMVPFALPGALGLVALACNVPLVRFFRRRRGASFAAAALLFHQLYYAYSSAVYLWCWCEQRLVPEAWQVWPKPGGQPVLQGAAGPQVVPPHAQPQRASD